jgi:hypothetical protein
VLSSTFVKVLNFDKGLSGDSSRNFSFSLVRMLCGVEGILLHTLSKFKTLTKCTKDSKDSGSESEGETNSLLLDIKKSAPLSTSAFFYLCQSFNFDKGLSDFLFLQQLGLMLKTISKFKTSNKMFFSRCTLSDEF